MKSKQCNLTSRHQHAECIRLQQLELGRHTHGNNHERDKNTNNPEEPPIPGHVLPGDRDVHAKHPGDKMARNEDGRQDGHLAEGRVDRQANAKIRRAQLRQTIRLRPADDLVDVRQRRQGRDEMVLHVAEVE